MKKPEPFMLIFQIPILALILFSPGCLKDQILLPGEADCVFEYTAATTSSRLLFSCTRDTCRTEKALNGLYVVMDNQSARIRRDYGAFDYPANPRWSPDGSKIAYNPGKRCDGHTCGDSILIIHADGTWFSKPVSDCGRNGGLFPVWAPDGKRIAYCRCAEQSFSIRTIGLHGEQEKMITRLEGSPLALDWSPDGSRFICVSTEGTYLLNADGSGLERFTALEDFAGCPGSPRWNHDGSRIIFTRDHWSAMPPIFTIGPDGSGLREIEYGMYPDWTANSEYLVYYRDGFHVTGSDGKGMAKPLFRGDCYSFGFFPSFLDWL